MRLVTNSVQPNKVETTEFGWRIKDVPFVKPMELAGGYVPEKSIKATANGWNGTPPTLNHPRDDTGQPIAANKKPELQLGRIENAGWDGEFVRGDIVVNEADLVRLGGEALDIRSALEDGDPINVSSQYRGEDLPAGTYDGEYRSNVEKIVQPDSVALLPNKPAQCSVEDGCGINPRMVANADVSIPMHGNAKHFDVGDLVTWPFGGGTGRGRVAESFSDPGTVTRTIEGTEVSREVSEDEGAYLVDVWRDADGEFRGQALKSGSELSAWQDPPEQVVANTDDGEIPEGMATNMVRANQEFDFALTDVTPDDVDSYTDSEWNGDAATAAMPNPSESDDNASALDAAHLLHPTSEEARDTKANWKLPFRDGPNAPVNTRALVAAKAAIEGARGGVDAPQEDLEGASERIEDFLIDAPSDLFGSMEEGGDMSDNTLREFGARVLSALQFGSTTASSGNEGAESPADTANDAEVMDRETYIEEITANSPLTEAALAERCDDGLEAIHADVMEANTEEDDSEESEVTENTPDDGVVELTESDLRGMIRDEVEQVTANQQSESEKHDLASEIVANSAEYDEQDAVLEDYPTKKALKTKKEDVAPDASGAGFPARGATTANTSDTEDYPDMDFGGD